MNILTMTQQELLESDLPYPSFRKKQLYHWIHKKSTVDADQMKNLPLKMREDLKARRLFPALEVVREQVSDDGTRKLLFSLNGDYAEAVLMQYRHGVSLCLSSQIGCKMGCSFCASTIKGFVRNITASEMIMMLYSANRYTQKPVNHVVFMGSGEPMENLDHIETFLRIITSPEGYNLSARHISLSTCGIPEGIHRLSRMGYPVTLALSLHAANNALRSELMPVNRRFDLEAVLRAAEHYQMFTHRRVTLEYALIEQVNDTPKHAEELAMLIRGKGFHLNLIPVNPIQEKDFNAPAKQRVINFQKTLEAKGIHVTIRRELGSDIAASCGQLRNEAIENNKSSGG